MQFGNRNTFKYLYKARIDNIAVATGSVFNDGMIEDSVNVVTY